MSSIYRQYCASCLPATLFLHFFNTAHFRFVDTLKYTCVCTQGVIPFSRVYFTLPIKVARPWHGTVTKCCFPLRKFHTNKHLTTSLWIVLSPKHVTLMLIMITSNHSRTLPSSFAWHHTSQTSCFLCQPDYLYVNHLDSLFVQEARLVFFSAFHCRGLLCLLLTYTCFR